MIREINLNAVMPVATALESQGVKLAARPGTPLALLMSRSFPLDQSQLGEDAKATLLSATALMTDEGEEGHSPVMDFEVDRVGKAIVKHAAFARDVVLPAVDKVYAAVRETAEEKGPIPFNVEQVWLHDAVVSPLVSDYSDRYADNPSALGALISGFPERTEEELTELVQTGSASYDATLADLLSRVDIVDVYNRYFRTNDGLTIERADGVASVRFGTLPMAANDNLLVHLLSRALMDHPHPESKQSLFEYKNALSNYVAASGSALHLLLNAWDKMRKNRTLVIKQMDLRPSAEKTIYVYGPIYQEFLEKDGSAEAIIGAYVSNQRQMKYLSEFIEALPKLKVAYNAWLAREDNIRLSNSGVIIRTAVADAMVKAINELTDANNVCNVPKEDMHRTAAELIARIPESEWIKAPYQVIRAVLCRSMFPTSNAFRILSLIDEQTEQHGLDDVRVAAYHAIKILLVDHFLTQVVKVS